MQTPTDLKSIFASKAEVFKSIFQNTEDFISKPLVEDIKSKLGASRRRTLGQISDEEWRNLWEHEAPKISDPDKTRIIVALKTGHEPNLDDLALLDQKGKKACKFLEPLLKKLFIFKDAEEYQSCIPRSGDEKAWIDMYLWVYDARSSIETFINRCREQRQTFPDRCAFRLQNLKHLLNQEKFNPRSKIPVGSLAAAFNQKFVDDGNFKLFSDNLENIAYEFYERRMAEDKFGEYLSPYMATVQSSGVGKSRLNIEYLKKNFGFYICSRPRNSTGYPPRSAYADFLKVSAKKLSLLFGEDFSGLENVHMYTTYYLCFVAACISILTDWLKGKIVFEGGMPTSVSGAHTPEPKVVEKTPELWLNLQLYYNDTVHDTKSVWKHILDRHIEFLALCMNSSVYNKLDIDISITRNRDSLWFTAVNLLNYICSEYSHCLNEKYKDLKAPTLFVKDEAKTYLDKVEEEYHDEDKEIRSYFHYMRFSEYFMPRDVKGAARITFSVLDTFGSVANFIPAELPDPSLRAVKANKIFRPFISLGWQINRLEMPDNRENQMHNLKNTGRYLWKTYDDYKDAMNVAKLKLLGTVDVSSATCSTKESLAILGSRSALSFHAEERLTYQLLQSHAATLHYITPDRLRLALGYPSEPTLALAASSLLNDHSNISWVECLEKLNDCLQTGAVQADERGEIAGRIMFLMAMDRERAKYNVLNGTKQYEMQRIHDNQIVGVSAVSLRLLLTRMFGEELLKNFTGEYVNLLEGVVNFTHFQYVSYSPNLLHLDRFYRCMAAISSKRNQEAVDFIIPAYLKSENRIFPFVIQMRLHEKGSGLSKISEDLAFDVEISGESGYPCVYLLMQLGQGAPAAYADKSMRLFRNDKGGLSQNPENSSKFTGLLLGAFGLSQRLYPFLQKEEVKVLGHIATAWVDPVKLTREDDTIFEPKITAKFIKAPLMLQYKDFLDLPQLAVPAPKRSLELQTSSSPKRIKTEE